MLNVKKCVVMRYGCKYNETQTGSLYYLNGLEMRLVKSHRDLGIVVNNSLNFHSFIDVNMNKANGLANQLLRYTVDQSDEFMVTFFVSDIRPLLDHCSSVWTL